MAGPGSGPPRPPMHPALHPTGTGASTTPGCRPPGSQPWGSRSGRSPRTAARAAGSGRKSRAAARAAARCPTAAARPGVMHAGPPAQRPWPWWSTQPPPGHGCRVHSKRAFHPGTLFTLATAVTRPSASHLETVTVMCRCWVVKGSPGALSTGVLKSSVRRSRVSGEAAGSSRGARTRRPCCG